VEAVLTRYSAVALAAMSARSGRCLEPAPGNYATYRGYVQDRRSVEAGMAAGLTAIQWRVLTESVRKGECTPLLGAGACTPTLPNGAQFARELATAYNYPLADCEDLARVAQFLALSSGDAKFPKQEIIERIRKCGYPEFVGEEPHHVLASLPLPVYLTTNYDDFLARALTAQGKDFRREYCRWRPDLAVHPTVWQAEKGYRPTAATPLVYHLHGCEMAPESLVLTEDDYLEFLYNIAKSGSITKTVDRTWEILPASVMKAISTTCLVFLGYRLADWNFRVIFRWLVSSLHKMQTRLKVAVQLVPGEDTQLRRAGQEYLDRYFKDMFDVVVFWGTAQQFVNELRRQLATADA
jgi:hypothetical protein